MAKTKILLSIEEDVLEIVKKQALENDRSTSGEIRSLIVTGLGYNTVQKIKKFNNEVEKIKKQYKDLNK